MTRVICNQKRIHIIHYDLLIGQCTEFYIGVGSIIINIISIVKEKAPFSLISFIEMLFIKLLRGKKKTKNRKVVLGK